MKNTVVIARYTEDLSWTNLIDSQVFDILVYNKDDKGAEMNLSALSNPITFLQSPNVGRESETFCRFICDHYDDLPEFTMFLQGEPFEHCTNTYRKIRNMIYSYERIRAANWRDFFNLRDRSDFLTTAHQWSHTRPANTSFDLSVFFSVQPSVPAVLGDAFLSEYVFDTASTAGKVYQEFFDVPLARFNFVAGAQYLVHKNQIRSKDKAFWKKCLDRHYTDGLFPWAMERFWWHFLFENFKAGASFQ